MTETIIKNKDKRRGSLKIILGISLIGNLILVLLKLINGTVWQDELFTLGILKNPIPKIITLTGMDVHPPLFYLFIKPFYELSHSLSFTSQVIFLRFICLLPLLGALFLSYKILRWNKFPKQLIIFH